MPATGRHKIEWRALDEIHAGICDSMTQQEIQASDGSGQAAQRRVQELYPEVLAARKMDKLSFRYPQGESYLDGATAIA